MELIPLYISYLAEYSINFWLLVSILSFQVANTVLIVVLYFKTRRRLYDMWERIKTFGQNLAGVLELEG